MSASFTDVLREVWADDLWSRQYGCRLVSLWLEDDLPCVILRDPGPAPAKHTFHCLDLTDWFYGPERFFRSLDRQLAEAGARHSVL